MIDLVMIPVGLAIVVGISFWFQYLDRRKPMRKQPQTSLYCSDCGERLPTMTAIAGYKRCVDCQMREMQRRRQANGKEVGK